MLSTSVVATATPTRASYVARPVAQPNPKEYSFEASGGPLNCDRRRNLSFSTISAHSRRPWAVVGASSANPLAPAAPRQLSLMARAEPSAPNETARPADPGPVLRDYSVESVRDGIAVINGRDGPQEVAPGDSVPGAGRVLRIEKQGNDWFVLTSRGVIASGPAP